MPDYRQNNPMAGLAELIGAGSHANAALAEQNRANQEDQTKRDLPMLTERARQQVGGETSAKNIDTLKGLIAGAKPGERRNWTIGADGQVAATESEESPYRYLYKQKSQESGAMKHAFDTYMKAFPDVQKRAQSASEGLEAINDPNQVGSVGQAKTLMIKNLGMNRYNQQEGNALVPTQFGQVVHQIFNAVGADNNPLTDTQRAALNSVFQNGFQQARKQHQMAKANAMQSYSLSGFYDPAEGEKLKSQMGADFDQQLDAIQERYKNVPKTGGYQPGASQVPQPQDQGLLGKLGSFLGISGKPQQQQPQPTPQSAQQPNTANPSTPQGQMRVRHKPSGQTGTIPANEFDPNVYEQVK